MAIETGSHSSGKTPPAVRGAVDAGDNDALKRDPAHPDGKVDIAVDESFPASDPPAHGGGLSGEPAPSSGYDEAAEAKRKRIAQRAHELWEAEGHPEGQDVEHWLRAESEASERAKD